MSKLAARKSRLIVEFSETVREKSKSREVVMEFTPYCISVRAKGLRKRYEISPAGIFNLAVKIAVEKRRAERKAKGGKR